MKILLALLLFLQANLAFNAHADCLSALTEENLKHVLNLPFNDVFRNSKTSGGERLRAFFSFLEIKVELGQRASEILLGIFKSQSNEQAFSNFQFSDRPERKLLVDAALEEMERRLVFVDRFLVKRPLKIVGEEKLLALYMNVILKDFDPELGFTGSRNADFSRALGQARDYYFQKLQERMDKVPLWSDPEFTREADLPADSTQDPLALGELVKLDNESIGDVVARISKISLTDYELATRSSIQSFEGLRQATVFDDVLVHRREGDPNTLVDTFEKGLKFLVHWINVPHDAGENTKSQQSEAEITKAFLIDLKRLLDGDLNSRFDSDLASDAYTRLHELIEELHHEITFSDYAQKLLFPNSGTREVLKALFAASRLGPVNFSE